MKILKTFFLTFFLAFLSSSVIAQDTLAISFDQFLEMALENAGQMKIAKTEVDLAKNQRQAAKNQRFLPSLRFQSEHALVPGVTSPEGRAEEEIYLDGSAYNDWSKVGLFTRLRVIGAQPVFIWGAVRKAVGAADLAIKAVQQQEVATREELSVVLHELYNSYILAMEIQRLLGDAEDTMGQIGRAMDKQREEDPDELDESDVFKFQVFKAQFGIQRAEVAQSLLFVEESWKYLLRNDENTIYEPEVRFLDPVSNKISDINYYQHSAELNRPELRALSFGEDAMKAYIHALKAQNLPGLYLGFTTTFASTPIRPRQPNPFINTPENTFNTALGFTIRQNLNFFQAKTSLERGNLEVRKIGYQRQAFLDQIMIQLNAAYREAAIAEKRLESTDAALKVAKEWLRSEQLDYDFGIGESKDLIDAVRQELELRLSEKQSIFEYNIAVAKLNKAAGLPLTSGLE